MKKAKKPLIVLLVLAIVIASVSIAANAAGSGNEKMTISLSASPATGAGPGDIVTVTMRLINNYMATTMCWPVVFSKTAFELVEATGNGLVGNLTATNSFAAVGANLTGVAVTDEKFFNADYPSSQYSCLLVQWIGNTNPSGGINYFYSTSGENVLTFKLRVKENPGESAKLAIPSDVKGVFTYQAVADTYNYTLYNIYSEVIPTTEFPFTFNNIEIALQTAAPGLAATAEYADDIVFMKTDPQTNAALETYYVYGFKDVEMYPINTESDIYYYLNPVGGTTLRITPSSGGYGTGTKIEVQNPALNNLVVEVYYIVIFGDVTGDSLIDVRDVTYVDNATMFLPAWTSGITAWSNPFFLACDVYGDWSVNSMDVEYVTLHAGYNGTVSQSHAKAFNYLSPP